MDDLHRLPNGYMQLTIDLGMHLLVLDYYTKIIIILVLVENFVP